MKKYPCLLIDQRIFWRQTQLLQTSCSLDSWRQRTSKQNTKIGAWKKKQIHDQRPKSAMFSCQHLKKKKKGGSEPLWTCFGCIELTWEWRCMMGRVTWLTAVLLTHIASLKVTDGIVPSASPVIVNVKLDAMFLGTDDT